MVQHHLQADMHRHISLPVEVVACLRLRWVKGRGQRKYRVPKVDTTRTMWAQKAVTLMILLASVEQDGA